MVQDFLTFTFKTKIRKKITSNENLYNDVDSVCQQIQLGVTTRFDVDEWS